MFSVAKNTLAPVSYTHLDVYKRQSLTTAGICGKIILAGVSACAARPAEDDEYRRFVHMKAKRMLSLLLTAALMLSMMTPVCYTHLDVYKRQVIIEL